MRQLDNTTYRALNGSPWAAVVMFTLVLFVSIRAFQVFESPITGITFASIAALILIATFRLREIEFNNTGIRYYAKIGNKQIWSCNYSNIKTININYLADTRIRNKKIRIHLKDGSMLKANATNILMEELGKICKSHDVKLLYDLNNKYVEYKLPQYKKFT